MMDATIESIPKNKKTSIIVLKVLVVLLSVSLIYMVILKSTNAVLAPYVNEDVYTFFISQLLIGISGILYGVTLLVFRSHSIDTFSSNLKMNMKPLIETMFLSLLFTILGFLFFILPGIIITILFYFYPFIVVEEKKYRLAALKRSSQLFKQVWFRLLMTVVGFYILFILSASMISFILPNWIAEVMSGAIIFMLETYVFYRLFQRARNEERLKREVTH